MELSGKLWQKIEDSFHFKKIKAKAPKVKKNYHPTEDELLDLNID